MVAMKNRSNAQTILVDIYDAWRARDLDWLASYLPQDFSHDLNIPIEMLAVGGTRVGKEAALDRLRQIFAGFDTQHIEPRHITLNGNVATLEVETRCMHRPSGNWLHTTKKHLWLLEDGWPVKLSEFYDLEQFAIFMNAARR
jgi:ketosteroid isomerase-like protein